ncbi:MAG: hypothetical protein ABI716_02360 [Candidatus Saccharibacteria bacterium]
MTEVGRIIPVVEVRETFTPSERLRDALVEFLDPELDQKTIESLRAAFLFKSWYRSLLDRDHYNHYERDRNGVVAEATHQFMELPHTPILFNGRVDILDSRSGPVRIVLQPRANGLATVSHNILRGIPTIEQLPADASEDRRLYVEIAKLSLASSARLITAHENLHQKTVHPAEARRHYVEPGQVIVRETMAAIPQSQERDRY